MSIRHSDAQMGEILRTMNKTGEALEVLTETVFERLETLEARASNSGLIAGGNDRVQREHKQLFESWIRKPDDPSRNEKLINIQSELSKKDVTIGSEIGGGYAVPEEISRMIERHELNISPVRQLAKVVRASTSDYKHLLSERLPSGGANWTSESGTRSATASPTLRQRAPTHGEQYALPRSSNWALEDVFFDVAQWLAEECGEQFGADLGAAFVTGNGTNRPTGLLNTTPTLGEDFGSPLRDAAAFMYITSDTDVDASPSSPGVRADSLIDTVYSLRSRYRANASWIMNSATTGAVRKLKAADGTYLWADGIAAGQPARLLGYPVVTVEDMQDVGAGNFPIGFGDWRRAWLLVDIGAGMRIIRDPYSTPGFTRFYVSRRVGGCVLNNDSARFLRTID